MFVYYSFLSFMFSFHFGHTERGFRMMLGNPCFICNINIFDVPLCHKRTMVFMANTDAAADDDDDDGADNNWD